MCKATDFKFVEQLHLGPSHQSEV